ncbi:hypothetical protein [Candidatus Coxiella mudrowiae]|nr:hypothetical protein [Candidatus Coxiella mudrowiae]
MGVNMVGRILLILSAFWLTGCTVGPRELGFTPQQWQMMNPTERKQLRANYYQIHNTLELKTVYQGPRIQVALFRGIALMPPLFQAYYFESVKFKIAPGKCQHVQLTSWDQAHFVKLTVCYDGLTLSMDPSRYDFEKAKGTLLLTYNPLWKHGFTYNDLSSLGYVRLQNTNVTIKTISNEAAVEDVQTAGP